LSSSVTLSKLGFGCASVMGKVGRTESLRAMSEAFELGVTHFDVARSYGFGRAESVLGQFIKGKRDQVTVTTKFGVVPPNLSLSKQLAIPTVRFLTQIFPQIKNKLKKKSGELLATRCFDVEYARKCLDESLTQLKTDYIDIYMLHEPHLTFLDNEDELHDFLESAISVGKIKSWGNAYKTPENYQKSSKLGGYFAQFEGNLSTYSRCTEIIGSAKNRIVTRPFIGGIEAQNEFLKLISKSSEIKMLYENSQLNIGDIGLSLSARLAGDEGAVVCSMFSSKHIQRNCKVLSDLHLNNEMQTILDSITKVTGVNL